MAEFPVQAEGISKAAYAPAVAFRDGKDLFGTGSKGAGEERVGLGDSENDAERIPAERLRKPLLCFLGLLAHPEFCALHGEADDASAGLRVVTINLSGRKS